jgi:hypothetical protein
MSEKKTQYTSSTGTWTRETVKKTFVFPAPVWEVIENFRFTYRIRFENEALFLLVKAGAEALSPKNER